MDPIRVARVPSPICTVLPLFGARKPIAISQSPFTEDEPRFSPDGKWLAYDSNESGSFQVYIVSVPEFDQKRQISVEGGVQPRWRRDGKELYYLGPDGAMMAVDFGTDPALEWGAPRSLFNTGLNVDPSRDQFAVTPDGQRFLLQLPSKAEASIPITVVMNWTGSLKK